MYLLVRECSFYTENNIVLGCFMDMELALSAKKQYITHIQERGDPHSQQGYKDVCLESDVEAIELDFPIDACTKSSVYLLYEQSECFGQVFRDIKCACSSLEKIIEFANTLPIDEDEDGFPTCFMYTHLVVDSLRFENDDRYIKL